MGDNSGKCSSWALVPQVPGREAQANAGGYAADSGSAWRRVPVYRCLMCMPYVYALYVRWRICGRQLLCMAACACLPVPYVFALCVWLHPTPKHPTPQTLHPNSYALITTQALHPKPQTLNTQTQSTRAPRPSCSGSAGTATNSGSPPTTSAAPPAPAASPPGVPPAALSGGPNLAAAPLPPLKSPRDYHRGARFWGGLGARRNKKTRRGGGLRRLKCSVKVLCVVGLLMPSSPSP